METNTDTERKPPSFTTKMEVLLLVAAVCVTAIWATLLFGSADNVAADVSTGYLISSN
ncbi:hypothetical protein K9B32_01255 [Rhizobium sp. 3T7]|uniref:hypothetical protein n=1 Tax=Rhizobium sp. 3T7 TaxID=2874922 RepID=UPI001CCE161C|nr:hypothetical protein [Rhizobium sp. 3T7]MBZ9788761.1 hypothetical protein [Rhizobium sp. 3T7]